MAIDLSGGEVRVIGNLGDEHVFRLSNPVGQDIINSSGEYEATFDASSVVLDLSEVATGTLIFPVLIADGIYRIRSLNPRRTLLTMVVESR